MRNLKLFSVCLFMMGLLFVSCETEPLSNTVDTEITSEENQNTELAAKIPTVQVSGNKRYVSMNTLNHNQCTYNGWAHYYARWPDSRGTDWIGWGKGLCLKGAGRFAELKKN